MIKILNKTKNLTNFINKKELIKKIEKKLKIIYKTLCISIISFLIIFDPNLLLISIYTLLLIFIFLTKKRTAFYYLFISSTIALIWMILSNNRYSYNQNMPLIFGLNSFPLFAWALGLFITYLTYSHLEKKVKLSNPIKKTAMFLAFYWPLLLSAEVIAYYLFNIKNLSTAIYSGLPFCNCIHAPKSMQFSYLFMGPLYFGICESIKSKKIQKSFKKRKKIRLFNLQK